MTKRSYSLAEVIAPMSAADLVSRGSSRAETEPERLSAIRDRDGRLLGSYAPKYPPLRPIGTTADGQVILGNGGPFIHPAGVTLPSRPQRSKLARIGPSELARIDSSGVLAIDASILGGSVGLLDAAPAAAPAADDEVPTVAAMRVDGPLAQRAISDMFGGYVDGYDAIWARFTTALDSKAGSVLLILDSPGGAVAGLQATVDAMVAAKKSRDKSVVVYVDEQAASAAYLIAAALGDEIIVPAAGRVGSIGCVGAFVDESAAWSQAGVKWHVVREPAGKAEAMPAAPLTELANERLRERISAFAETFIEAVAGYRPVSAKKIRAFDAATFSGADAVANGLADRVGSLGDAITLAMSKATDRTKKMKLSTIVAAQVGLVPDAAVEAVADRFETVALEIMGATGADSLASAGKAFAAMAAQVEHAKGATADLAAEVAQLRAEAKAHADATEAGKLAALIDKLATDGKLPPSRREAFAANAAKHGLAWAQATAEMMAPIVASSPALPKVPGSAVPAEGADDEFGNSPREQDVCAETGCDPRVYAAIKSKFRGSAATA